MSAPAMTTTRRRSWIDEWEEIPPASLPAPETLPAPDTMLDHLQMIATGLWDHLVWAINHDGQGQSEAFDVGFRACLRALGVSDHDIAVLFGEAITEHQDT